MKKLIINVKSGTGCMAVCLSLLLSAFVAVAAPQEKPNILFITMDDMNWDSVGCFGSTIEDISPNIDSLAERGMRFQYGFIQSSVCTPSRNAMQTGCYPHVSGVHGFYSVVFPGKTISQYLREQGYFTAIHLKLPDSTPTNDYKKYWDFYRDTKSSHNRNPAVFGSTFKEIIDQAEAADKPFYALINIIDTHLPFYRGPTTQKGNWDRTPPSREYGPDEVPIPGFLPQSPAFAQEMADYYSSVRRGDDSVGEILRQLRENKLEENTIIFFLSDHGMALPFAKSNLYPDGVRTPWIVVWPGVTEPGVIDTEHMVCSIDYLPTILEMTGLSAEEKLEGRSIVPLLKGETPEWRDYIFVELNENPNADVRPMRAVYDKEFVYIFNPWSNGERIATMECRWYRSWNTMTTLSKTDKSVRERFEHLKHRQIEELYHYSTDPFALNNLIDHPDYQDAVGKLHQTLEEQMIRTDDYVLPAFRARRNPETLETFMAKEQEKALDRAKDVEWKRWKNQLGPAESPDRRPYDPKEEL